ncbi:MAG: aldehyde dehydrogenase family protein, partial [Acidimicrobiales bacterium]|nr:aldehyde dehydrogenase family protein [Acidimicrobiales bacterium]
MSTREQIYIGGAWVPSDGNGSIDVVNPSNEEVIGSIPEGTAADVDAAVAAANAAFPSWSAAPLEERLGYIEALGVQLAARSEEIGSLISREVGMPLGLS